MEAVIPAAVDTQAKPARKWRRELAPATVALLAVVAVWLPRLSGPIDLRYDAGVYYVLGTALAEGRGYRLLNEPGDVEAVQYPPLLPLFVAAHQKLLGTSDPVIVGTWLRRSFFGLSAWLALATYAVARLYLERAPALLATLLSSLSLYTYFLSDLLFAELPFTLASTLFVLASRSPRRFAGPLTGALAVSGYLLRGAGLALLAAWVGEALVQWRLRQAALRGAVALAPILLWYAHVERVVSSPAYASPAYAYQRAPYQYYNVTYAENAVLVDPFRPEQGRTTLRDLPLRTIRNARALAPRLGEIVSVPRNFWTIALRKLAPLVGATRVPWRFTVACLVLLGLGAMLGTASLARRGELLVPLYVVASLGLVAVTPWPAQYLRYVAPLAPFLAVGLVRAALDGLGRLRGSGARLRLIGGFGLGVVGLSVAVLQAFTLDQNFRRYQTEVGYTDLSGARSFGRLLYYDEAWREFDDALEWLKADARADDVVATSAPHWTYLRTGLKAVMPPFEAEPGTAQRLLDSVPARYLVVDDLAFSDMSRHYGAPVARARRDLWTPVYAGSGGLRVYKRRD